MASRRIAVFFYGLFMDADLLRTKGAHPLNPALLAFLASHFASGNGQPCFRIPTPAPTVL